MSYYDFEHFWSPKQVCGQKSPPQNKTKVTIKIKKFLSRILGNHSHEAEISSDRSLTNREEAELETNSTGDF